MNLYHPNVLFFVGKCMKYVILPDHSHEECLLDGPILPSMDLTDQMFSTTYAGFSQNFWYLRRRRI